MAKATMQTKIDTLTPRQKEILRLVSLGCDSGEIAEILDVAPSTVNNHRTNLMTVLGVNKAAVLTRLAIKYKISPITDVLTTKEKRLSGRRNDGWN
jgi:DNA-binding CsgD family transcriptional regulator